MAPHFAEGVASHIGKCGPIEACRDDDGRAVLFPRSLSHKELLTALAAQQNPAYAHEPLHCAEEVTSVLTAISGAAPKLGGDEPELSAPPPTSPASMATAFTLLHTVKLLQTRVAAALVLYTAADNTKEPTMVSGMFAQLKALRKVIITLRT